MCENDLVTNVNYQIKSQLKRLVIEQFGLRSRLFNKKEKTNRS